MLSAYLFYPSFCTIFRIPIFNLFFFYKISQSCVNEKIPVIISIRGVGKTIRPGAGNTKPRKPPQKQKQEKLLQK